MSFLNQWENARHELLDLSFRNPLLNYRSLKSRGLQFHEADLPATLKLLLSEKPVKFAPLANETKTAVLPWLQTLHIKEDLEKRTLKTFYDARSSLEEQGVNTLFLAFGFLKWFESDDSQVPHHSPLFLLPVELKRGKAGEGFELRATGEDGGSNLSIATLLKRDFRLELPVWPEEQDMDLPRFFAQIQDALRPFPRFEIVDDLALAFFSFTKFLMFRDLESQTEFAQKHAVLSALLGSGFPKSIPTLADETRLDEALPLTQSHIVSDADSSQILAVHEVKEGRNLVIQGPPGTGKSQTITNIIAQAMAQGQTVLFVSEKMAALQVVKSRLDALGLGDACLELHSNKTNKKALLGELQRTFDLPCLLSSSRDENSGLLSDAVRRLNDYDQAINSPIEQSELTLHQIYGLWLQNEEQITAKSLEIQPVEEGVLASKTPAEVAVFRALVAQTQNAIARTGALAKHPFGRSKLRVLLPTDERAIRAQLADLLSLLGQLQTQSAVLAQTLQTPTPTQNSELQPLLEAAKTWQGAPDWSGLDAANDSWLTRQEEIERLLLGGEKLAQLGAHWGQQLHVQAWQSDVAPLRLALQAHGKKWFRALIPAWRAAQKTLASLCTADAPKEVSAQLEIVAAIEEFQRTKPIFDAAQPLAQTLFGARWNGWCSDFPALRALSLWLFAAHQNLATRALPPNFFGLTPPHPNDLRVCQTISELLKQIEIGRERLQKSLEWDGEPPRQWAIWQSNLSLAQNQLERLPEVVAFNGLRARLNEEKLKEFEKLAQSWPDAGRGLVYAFERAYLESLLRVGMKRAPFLNGFDGGAHDQLTREFRALDLTQLQKTSRVTAARHLKNIADLRERSFEEPFKSQLKILRHQWQLQRAHRAPRALIASAPHTLQVLKPVWMMSPLSVASFLPAETLQFDLVIFDEASQVRPVEAFGALLRGHQAVVAGDSKQLPPTSFFDKLARDDDDENDIEEVKTGDLESILGLFCAQGAPERMLRWHYRSRHESLIAVSNREFYDDRLIVFPSPDAAREKLGLICHYLPHTAYNASINREEAKAVAVAVMNHAREQLARPTSQRRTLGVAAFSVKQSQEILDQLEVLRRQNGTLEEFFTLDGHEPFFVKNLENVQGDERDVMFLSIGYGRDESGKVAMKFGPVGNPGGERRLNVLITRARLRCEVFTNLRADDIDLSRAKGVGVRALKQFLAFAQNGQFALSLPSNREMDSPFEVQVKRAVEDLGFVAVPQVGCAGYFIDLAIQDPQAPGRFVLGVECDGASYHSAASARDRDRLRAQVLENMGWKLHRIWSTDWFQNPQPQRVRLKNAIEQAIQETNSS